MLQNARVTTFTVSELLRENQLGGGGGGLKLPSSQIRVIVRIFLSLRELLFKSLSSVVPFVTS